MAMEFRLEGRRATEFVGLLREIDARLKRDGVGYLFAEPTVPRRDVAGHPQIADLRTEARRG